jgi:hypothetical protein
MEDDTRQAGVSVGYPINEFLMIARLTLRDPLRRYLVHRALPLFENGYVGGFQKHTVIMPVTEDRYSHREL